MTATEALGLSSLERKELVSSKLVDGIRKEDIPKHVAIIMDGNRRWAHNRKLSPMIGHWEGAEALTDIVRASADFGIRTLTVYAFSTENWARQEAEINSLMEVVELFLIRKREMMVQEGICLDAIGDLSRLPMPVRKAFFDTRQATKHCSRINLVLALNYGARDEIRRAIGHILARHEEKKIESHELTEQFIAQYLDTERWGDPELLIRTSGELRVSNFLLWQISYAELYVTDVLWPDFTSRELMQALVAFQARKRRLGGGS
jgi:undecaprenyl diphosphate synthase